MTNAVEININPNCIDASISKINQATLSKLKKEIRTLEKQISKTFDLLEQDIYDNSTFSVRNTELTEKKKKAEEQLQALSITVRPTKTVQQIKSPAEIYWDIKDITVRNTILKTILKKVYYAKSQRNTRGNGNNPSFELEIYPLLFSEYQN